MPALPWDLARFCPLKAPKDYRWNFPLHAVAVPTRRPALARLSPTSKDGEMSESHWLKDHAWKSSRSRTRHVVGEISEAERVVGEAAQ